MWTTCRPRAVIPFYGRVAVRGAKSAALPLMAGALLRDGPCDITIARGDERIEVKLVALGAHIWREG